MGRPSTGKYDNLIEDIKQYASLMKHIVSGNACTIGNESKIKSIDLFEKVHTL